MNVVLWGKDESILPKMILPNAKIKLFGVRTKTGNRGLEIHGNDATILEIEGKHRDRTNYCSDYSLWQNQILV